jgi:molybdenum cofactor synthesis domain-containing protein
MIKEISVEEAVGLPLAHDVTEIRPSEFKGPAFKKGYIVRQDDVEHLRRIGKSHLYILQPEDDELHEDDAIKILARALCGDNVGWEGEPREGKLVLRSLTGGLLKVDISLLFQFNMVEEVMCATRHTNTVVRKGQEIAGTRVIPLLIKKKIVEEAAGLAQMAGGILSVKTLAPHRVGLIITGNEVYYGIIEDRFESAMRSKVISLGSEVAAVDIVPDDMSRIAETIRTMIENGIEVIVTTGGMSVDPDDVTRAGIKAAGAQEVIYGSPVLPGAMFLSARVDSVPILGVPACGIFNHSTVFDLVFPRILAGEKISRRDIAVLGHGGLCLNCPDCRFPDCPFGKTGEWISAMS